MFKDRAVQVTMVKKNDLEPPAADIPDPKIELVANASEAVERVVEDVTKLVLIYIAADTVRKVILAVVSR